MNKSAAELFVKELLSEISDWDGHDLQELAVKHGLMYIYERVGSCGESCACDEYFDDEEPRKCYRLAI